MLLFYSGILGINWDMYIEFDMYDHILFFQLFITPLWHEVQTLLDFCSFRLRSIRLTQFLQKEKYMEWYTLKDARNFSLGNASAVRRMWRKNTAGRQHTRRGGHARPIRFQFAGVWIYNGFPRICMYSLEYVYLVPTCKNSTCTGQSTSGSVCIVNNYIFLFF